MQNNNSNVSLAPAREYLNVEDQMEEILKENKGKAPRAEGEGAALPRAARRWYLAFEPSRKR